MKTNIFIHMQIYVDGASRGNPGPAAYAFILLDENGKQFHQGFGYIGEKTNNSAEYIAIFNALKAAKKFKAKYLQIYSDSQLVVKQLKGEFKINKPHLRDLHKEVILELKNYKTVEFFNVRRTDPNIQKCDELCNKCLDKKGF
ncbi:MAG: ribonuclease HI family protein [Promethearchaeota archaeon]